MNEKEVFIDGMSDLVKFVFSDNYDNNKMIIQSTDFNNTRDLYFFCIELTIKGIAKLFGNDNETVDISLLSIDDINIIKQKLSNAAIELILDIIPLEEGFYNDNENSDIIYDIPHNDLENNYKLEDYSLIIRKKEFFYSIKFKIIEFI